MEDRFHAIVQVVGEDRAIDVRGRVELVGKPVWKVYELTFTPDEMFHIHRGESIVLTFPYVDVWGAKHG